MVHKVTEVLIAEEISEVEEDEVVEEVQTRPRNRAFTNPNPSKTRRTTETVVDQDHSGEDSQTTAKKLLNFANNYLVKYNEDS